MIKWPCPECGVAGEYMTIDTRWRKKSGRLVRRRKCLTCGHRFNTVEVPERGHAPPSEQMVHDMEIAAVKFVHQIRNIADG